MRYADVLIAQIPFKGGAEYDYLSRARRYHHPRAGTAKLSKRSYQRRLRQQARRAIRAEE